MVPGFDFAVIVGVLAAAGTPQAAIDRIAAEMEAVAKMPDTIQVLANAGVESVGGKPADYGKAILDENERLAKAIKAAGIKQE
jgi:tripartite-type tricarboxylate transporter receptor subunit TctC